ncbi:hypothetical protein QTP86_030755, partial [Hemibagrus guttatus]
VKVDPNTVGQREVKVTCSSTCRLNTHGFYWYRNGNIIKYTNEASTVLDSTSGSDEGSYSCEVSGTDHRSPPVCVLGKECWGVTYTPERVCALKGTSIDLSCSYKYPAGHTVIQSVWFIKEQVGVDPEDVREDEEYQGRVQYTQSSQNDCSLRITNLRGRDAQTYRFRFHTDHPTGQYTRTPGVTLSVTDLKITVSDGYNGNKKLSCITTCTLSNNPTYIWYKNGQRVINQYRNELYFQSKDAGSYSCAVRGHEELRSAAVCCELEEKERFWSELDEVMESIPTGERVVIGADFNGHVGEGNRGDEEVMGKFGVKERNLEGPMVVDFAKRMDMGVVNTYVQKREEHRVTYKSGGRRTQVDYILCRRGNLKEISDCKVVVGESVARQHRMVVCRMTLMVCKTKRSKIEIEKKTKWWKLKKEECCEEFRQKLRQALGGQVVLPNDWETTAEVIRETGRKVLGVSSGRRKEDKETWWWNAEVQDSIQRKRLAKKKWDMDRTEENRQEYKELQRRVKREVSKAKQKAYDELYTRLDTREGEKDLYRLARQRDRDGKDVQQKVDKIRKDEVRKALKRMKSGKAVGPDDIPVEVWKCLGEAAVEFLTSLFNRVLENLEKAYDRVPREELWYCMKKSGVAEKYVRVVQDMHERSRTVVRCAVVMDQLSEEVRQESPWTMMFADDIVICSESREQVEENLEMWRFALERRGMKVSCIQSNGECGKEVKKTVVRPAMLYGLETVSLRKRQESELEVAELKMSRFSLGVTRLDRMRNEYIRGAAHVGRLGAKVREARLRWFGYVQRRENSPKNTSAVVFPSGDTVEGDSVTLSCSSDANPPVLTYSWFKQSTAADTLLTTGQNYSISNISSQHSGLYYCTAHNQLGHHDSTPAFLHVLYTPKNTRAVVLPSGDTVEGDSVTLSCSSDADPPVLTYIWFKQSAAADTLLTTGQNYSISNISSQHSGLYYCTAHNQLGCHNSTPTHLDVLYPPRNLLVSVIPSASGDMVTLLCRSDSNPNSSYTWLDVEVILLKSGEDGPDVMYVFFQRSRVHQDIIDICNNTLSEDILEHLIDKRLQNRRSIGVQAQGSVTLSSQSLCAVTGSTVTIPCTFTKPYSTFTQREWYRVQSSDGEPRDLNKDPEYSGRVSVSTRWSDCELTVKGNDWISAPSGVQLTVTDLQVKVDLNTVGQREVKVTCSSTCRLKTYRFYWYRNGHYLKYTYDASTVLDSTSRSDEGSYSCKVYEHEKRSPPVCVLGKECWGVTYTPERVCALKNTSIDLSCSYKYPAGHTVIKSVWFIKEQVGVDPEDVREDEEYQGRVQYTQRSQNDCSLRITNLRERDAQTYRFRFHTDHPTGKYTGTPGVTLSVTDLKVTVSDWNNWKKKLSCITTCTLSNNPTYIWYKNGQSVTDQYRNELYVSSEDAGSYSCAVRGHEELRSPAVCVFDEKSCWSVTYSTQTVCSLIGSSVGLHSYYTFPNNYKVTEVLWFIKDLEDMKKDEEYQGRVQYTQSSQNDCSLRITNLRGRDAQTYRFRFHTDHPTGKYTGTPGVTLSVTDLKVTVSDWNNWKKKLSCITTCTLSNNPTYIWYKNGQRVINQYRNELYVSSEDAGSYSCAVRGHEELHSPAVYSPKNTSAVVLPSGDTVEGESVTLSCSSDANPPVLSYSWFKQSAAADTLLTTGQNYSISNISSQHSGLYYCTAHNQLGHHNSTPTHLDVLYSPKNTSAVVLPSGDTVEGDSVTLSCSSDANPPVSNYTWFKQSAAADTLLTTGQNYSISNISSQHSGLYYCTAHNQLGHHNSTPTHLDVLYPPRNLFVSVIPSVSGDMVTLLCRSDSNPNSSYTWYRKTKGGVILVGNGTSLTLSSREDGFHYCTANNRFGSSNSSEWTYTSGSRAVKYVASGFTVALVLSLLIIAVILWMKRRKAPAVPTVRSEENSNNDSAPVYSNISAMTSDPTQTASSEDQDTVQYSSIFFRHSHTQEVPLYSTVQLSKPLNQEQEVEYATVNPNTSRAVSEDQIYSNLSTISKS